MPEKISVTVNGEPVRVPEKATALAAILASGSALVRRSVSGEARGPLCGMGICFECRATINNQRHRRTCQLLCSEGMQIRTDE